MRCFVTDFLKMSLTSLNLEGLGTILILDKKIFLNKEDFEYLSLNFCLKLFIIIEYPIQVVNISHQN